VAVYDVLGRRVGILVDGIQPAGWHDIRFDAADLPSGLYFVHLEAGAFRDSKAMMVAK
jgi:hypothetical protein